MKKALLTLTILLATASLAMAHCGVCGTGAAKGSEKGSSKGSMMGSMKAKADTMFEGLNLTEEQTAKIEVLKEAKGKAIQAAKDEFAAGIKAILTPEQLKIYKTMHKDHKH